jgi:hypothetical protein
MIETAKPIAAASAISWPERDRADPRRAEALAEKRDREQRGPDRHRELDRDDLGDRDQRQGEEPAELGAVVDRVAGEMRADAPRPHRRQAAARVHQRPEQDEAEQRAQLHDLEHVQRARRLAAGDGDDDHRRQPARHPDGGLASGGDRGRHGGDSGPAPHVTILISVDVFRGAARMDAHMM